MTSKERLLTSFLVCAVVLITLAGCNVDPWANNDIYSATGITQMCPVGTENAYYPTYLSPCWVINPLDEPSPIRYQITGIKDSTLTGVEEYSYQTYLTPYLPNNSNELLIHPTEIYHPPGQYELTFYVPACGFSDGSACYMTDVGYDYDYIYTVNGDYPIPYVPSLPGGVPPTPSQPANFSLKYGAF